MVIETWDHFTKALYWTARSSAPVRQKMLDNLVEWGKKIEKQANPHDVKHLEITVARTELFLMIPTYVGDARQGLELCWRFLGFFLITPESQDLKTKEGCKFWGYYYYENSCHEKEKAEPIPITPIPVIPEPIPVPPIPMPPYVPTCSDYKSQVACLDAGCYWYDNSCHSKPEPTIEPPLTPFGELAKQVDAYCETIPKINVVKKTTCILVRDIISFLDDFFTWQSERK